MNKPKRKYLGTKRDAEVREELKALGLVPPGALIKSYAVSKGLTAKAHGVLCGIGECNIWKYYSDRLRVTPTICVRLLGGLGVPPSEIAAKYGLWELSYAAAIINKMKSEGVL